VGVDQGEEQRRVVAKMAAADGFERGGDDPAGIRQSEADRLGADIEADQPSSRRHRLAQFHGVV
jgi:hypothetical protein